MVQGYFVTTLSLLLYIRLSMRFSVQLALFSRLCNEVLERRVSKRYDAESIMLAAKLLEQNPEVYTVWNYRREALAGTFQVRYLRNEG